MVPSRAIGGFPRAAETHIHGALAAGPGVGKGFSGHSPGGWTGIRSYGQLDRLAKVVAEEARRRGRGLPGGSSASVTPGQERLVLAAFEAGDRLFICTRLDPSQWKSARTTNGIERLNEEFRRRIKTQTVLPCPETVPMLL